MQSKEDLIYTVVKMCWIS